MHGALPLRRPNLEFVRRPGSWTPAAPELASIADALSLAMPYAEPCVVTTIREVIGDLDLLDPVLADQARSYAAQEAAHQGMHRRYNELVRREGRLVPMVERMIAFAFRWLSRRRRNLRVAWVVGFESLAFAGARWIDPRADRLFADADSERSSLFLWHLAEEAEHRSVAFDVLRVLRVRKSTQLLGLLLAIVTLGGIGFVGTVALQVHRRRLFHPIAWLTMLWWTLSYVFMALPLTAMSFTRDHDPSTLAEPSALTWWLGRFDHETATLPAWHSVT